MLGQLTSLHRIIEFLLLLRQLLFLNAGKLIDSGECLIYDVDLSLELLVEPLLLRYVRRKLSLLCYLSDLRIWLRQCFLEYRLWKHRDRSLGFRDSCSFAIALKHGIEIEYWVCLVARRLWLNNRVRPFEHRLELALLLDQLLLMLLLNWLVRVRLLDRQSHSRTSMLTLSQGELLRRLLWRFDLLIICLWILEPWLRLLLLLLIRESAGEGLSRTGSWRSNIIIVNLELSDIRHPLLCLLCLRLNVLNVTNSLFIRATPEDFICEAFDWRALPFRHAYRRHLVLPWFSLRRMLTV